jgi:hypothetical protein
MQIISERKNSCKHGTTLNGLLPYNLCLRARPKKTRLLNPGICNPQKIQAHAMVAGVVRVNKIGVTPCLKQIS